MKGLPVVHGKFGHGKRVRLDTTVSANKKGGMNSEIFINYLEGLFDVYPDMEDVPGKRVIVLLDGGPGRDEIEAYCDFAERGLYCLPLVPNLTHIVQPVDNIVNVFKIAMEKVKKQLLTEKGRQLTVADIPCVLNGRGALLDSRTGEVVRSAIHSPCQVLCDASLVKKAWFETGFWPMNRKALEHPEVKDVVRINADGEVVADANEATKVLLEQEEIHQKNLVKLRKHPLVTGPTDSFEIEAGREEEAPRLSQSDDEIIRAALTSSRMGRAGAKWFVVGCCVFSSDILVKMHEMKERAKENVARLKEYKSRKAQFGWQERGKPLWESMTDDKECHQLPANKATSILKYLRKYPSGDPDLKTLQDAVFDEWDKEAPKDITEQDLKEMKASIGPTDVATMPIPIAHECFPFRRRREKVKEVANMVAQGKLTTEELQSMYDAIVKQKEKNK